MDKFLKTNFYINNLPQWHCPSCKIGLLEIVDSVKFIDTAKSTRSREHPEFDYEWVDYTAHGVLKCNNSKCGEHVAMIGTGNVEIDQYLDDYGQFQQEHCTIITPTYFQPSLAIFFIPEYVPKKISDMLYKIFCFIFL